MAGRPDGEAWAPSSPKPLCFIMAAMRSCSDFHIPIWFQSFGAVMGMDWHSSGITDQRYRGLKARSRSACNTNFGLHVCGGRGKHSRRTPQELIQLAERIGFDGGGADQSGRLVAKVDSAAVQDGFDLYLHGFIVADDGKWTVVQQGMNGDKRQARRYHWHK